MPPQRSPGRGGGGAPTEEQTALLIQQMAESSQHLTNAVANLATSQASFMRSAADADANIGLSKAHPFIPSELAKARAIDNTVDNDYRNGLPKSARDTIEPPYLFNDNKGTTQTVNNPVTNSNTKHVATKEFRTRQYIAQRLLRVCYIPTDMNIADFFTKALTETPFCKFRAFLGISE